MIKNTIIDHMAYKNDDELKEVRLRACNCGARDCASFDLGLINPDVEETKGFGGQGDDVTILTVKISGSKGMKLIARMAAMFLRNVPDEELPQRSAELSVEIGRALDAIEEMRRQGKMR